MTQGTVQIVYVDFAMHGQPAVRNAEAVHCAADQGRFWAYHDLLYLGTSEEGMRYNRPQLDAFAKKLNLDMATFGQCLNDHKYQDFVIAAYDEGRQLGIKVVPTFLINERMVEGFIPFADLQPIIEAELAKAGGK